MSYWRGGGAEMAAGWCSLPPVALSYLCESVHPPGLFFLDVFVPVCLSHQLTAYRGRQRGLAGTHDTGSCCLHCWEVIINLLFAAKTHKHAVPETEGTIVLLHCGTVGPTAGPVLGRDGTRGRDVGRGGGKD